MAIAKLILTFQLCQHIRPIMFGKDGVVMKLRTLFKKENRRWYMEPTENGHYMNMYVECENNEDFGEVENNVREILGFSHNSKIKMI